MFHLLKKARLLAPIPVCLAIMLALVAPVSGQRPNPNVDVEQQRSDQYDRQQQQQQQQQSLDSLSHARNGLDEVQNAEQRQELERAQMKYLLREHFRRHFRVIRNDAEELTLLASKLQSYAESSPEPALNDDMRALVARIQKLAHEVRTNMADRGLPKVKPSSETIRIVGTSMTDFERKKALLEKSKAITDSTSRLKKAVEGYLASDNEQTVSVGALKNANDKTRFDPNSVEILNSSMQAEQLACDIRAQFSTDRVH